jgi:hypothetical protein
MTSHDQRTASVEPHADEQDLDMSHRSDAPHRRLPVHGSATAFELSGQHSGQMHNLRQLAFTNAGLEADSDDGIPCGITLTIGFQAEEHSAKRGRVTVCEPREKIYHIAVRVEPGAPPGC